MKNSNCKTILKNLNRQPADQAFLSNFRQELDSFVQARPIAQPGFFMLFGKTATVLGMLVFVVLSGGGLVYASQGSLPGQLLYPVKIAAEETRLAITTKPEKRKELQLEFIDKRVNEANIISKENNASRNAEKALAIIDEKIKEIEKLESEDASPADKTQTFKNDSTKETPAIQPTATATISATDKPQESNGKAEPRPDQAQRNRSNALEKSKARLKESHAILEQLINSGRQDNRDGKPDDRSQQRQPDSPAGTTTGIEGRDSKTRIESRPRSSDQPTRNRNDSQDYDKEKKPIDGQKRTEELKRQKETGTNN
jgi:hypothetical protein